MPLDIDALNRYVEKRASAILAQRESIIEAFIAQHGCKPDECEQVIGPDTWYIRKRPQSDHTETLPTPQ